MSYEMPPYPVLWSPIIVQIYAAQIQSLQHKYHMTPPMLPVPLSSILSMDSSLLSPLSINVSSPPTSSSQCCSSTSNSDGSPSPVDRKVKRESPRSCTCHVCGKVFSRHWLLQGHIRTHTGEKPFKCETCGKAFADKSNLRAHAQTHSGYKPHSCSRCGKRFALKSYLSKHEESSCARPSTSSAEVNPLGMQSLYR